MSSSTRAVFAPARETARTVAGVASRVVDQTVIEQAAEPYGSIRGRASDPVMSFDGTQLYVEEAGSGPTVVFAHGMCLNLTSWHHQIRELPSEYRLVLYDQRGHGLSGRPTNDDWSIQAFARDLEAVIAATKGPDPVYVVGHSLGGMALLQYCEMF